MGDLTSLRPPTKCASVASPPKPARGGEMMPNGDLNHRNSDYDACFETAPERIQWYPWVGNRYTDRKTKIMILGIKTYKSDNPTGSNTWDQAIFNCEYRSANIELAMGHGINLEEKPCLTPYTQARRTASPGYYKMTNMFLKEAGKAYKNNPEARKMFWESVAFANFCQCAAENQDAPCPQDFKEPSYKALLEMFKILKPDLCIAWSVRLWNFQLSVDGEDNKISTATPRFTHLCIPSTPPTTTCVVGIKCPADSFPSADWMRYLRSQAPQKCQDAVNELLECLS